MVELIIAVSCAIVISAGCSLFEAVLYSVPMRHVETTEEFSKNCEQMWKSRLLPYYR
jgi:spore coat polysaccharide biosynthesis predicted glycosyltransferase SpsG